jgi:ATP-binding cassette subfamily B protein
MNLIIARNLKNAYTCGTNSMSEYEDPKFSLSALRQMFRNSRRLSGIIFRERKIYFLSIFFLFTLLSAVPFVQAGLRALLINHLITIIGHPIDPQLVSLIVFTVLAFTLPAFLYTAEAYAGKLFWFYLEEKFMLLIVEHKSNLDAATLEDPKLNDLFNKIQENGVWRVQNFADRQFYLWQNIIEVVIASGILLIAQWWIFLIIFLATLPELFTEIKYGRQVWGIHTAGAELRRKFWHIQWHFNNLSSLIELKLFQNTGNFFQKLKGFFQDFRLQERKSEKKKLILQIFSLIISQSAIAFATVWFILEVSHGWILIGTMIFYLSSMGDLRQSLSSLFSNLGRQYQDSLFLTDVFSLLDLPPTITKPTTPLFLKKGSTPSIIFDHVSFRYPNTKNEVLHDINLAIHPGEKLALIGINGAGKTTLIKLLCRFYDPTDGRILINGHDLRSLDLESWYHHLGVLFQDYAQYNFPAKESIAVGRSDERLSLSKVIKAAEHSEASEFINEWPNKFEQQLGKEFHGGVEPSIGQWQKLALARTFYRQAHVLILDEPTASIDAEAEAKIFERLETLPKSNTVILISHRFSTVRHADHIAVIENGQINEYGSHEELLLQGKTYARLFDLQAEGYK